MVENCGVKLWFEFCLDEKFKLVELLWMSNEVEFILIFFVLLILRFVLVDVVFGEKYLFMKNEMIDFDFMVNKISDVRDLNFNWKLNLVGL